MVIGSHSWFGFGCGYFVVGEEGCGDTPSFYYCESILYLVVVEYCVGLHLLIAAAKMVQGRWKSPQSVNPSLNPSLVKNILRQGSKEGFKEGGRVHGKGLQKGSRKVEETTISEPILEPKPCKNYSKAMIHRESKSYELIGAKVRWVLKKSRVVHQLIDEVEVDDDYDSTGFVSLQSQNIYYGDLIRKKLFTERGISLEKVPKTLPRFYQRLEKSTKIPHNTFY
ncbi:hypothetical protein H5410_064725 [Solanum commersonii]|uniref:Uncharacterized protein n=1 Tax=Solanum commersonii TaxID=4109 RepID=A0A9J5VYP2_SOLCO|nr:hypothetical protein H5410_064725 [Solanum commersonii]